MTTQSWPPPYHIRLSNRAKSINLRITPQHGLELVIPARIKRYNAEKIIRQHRAWIERHYHAIETAHAYQQQGLPHSLNLNLLQQQINIYYKPTLSQQLRLSQPQPNTLLFQGNVTEQEKIKQRLRRWLQDTATPILSKRLAELSQHTELAYRRIQVRYLKSRWGSCSHEHDICLNSQLLFFDKTLVDYVIIHELCHTIHFDHSRKFWQLVRRFCPNYLQLKKQLNQQQHYFL